VRTAGTAREKVAGGNLLQILTAGDDGEDEEEPKPSTIATGRRRRPRAAGETSSKGPYSTWRKNPPADFLQMQDAESGCAIRG
jgi:hypothetical protein